MATAYRPGFRSFSGRLQNYLFLPNWLSQPLCSSFTGSSEAQVTQAPRHLITETGKKLIITCSQNMNHDYMFWYRQDSGLGLKLIYYSINADHVDKGEVSDGYSVSRNEKKAFPLTLESTRVSQTSLYLCASSYHSSAQPAALCTKRTATWARSLYSQEAPLQSRESTIFSHYQQPWELSITPRPRGLSAGHFT